MLQRKNQRSGSKSLRGFSISFLKESLRFKVKKSMLFFDQKSKLGKSYALLERRTLCFISFKNCELKTKLINWSSLKKSIFFFVQRSFCSKGIFVAFVFYFNVSLIIYYFYCHLNKYQITLLRDSYYEWPLRNLNLRRYSPTLMKLCNVTKRILHEWSRLKFVLYNE